MSHTELLDLWDDVQSFFMKLVETASTWDQSRIDFWLSFGLLTIFAVIFYSIVKIVFGHYAFVVNIGILLYAWNYHLKNLKDSSSETMRDETKEERKKKKSAKVNSFTSSSTPSPYNLYNTSTFSTTSESLSSSSFSAFSNKNHRFRHLERKVNVDNSLRELGIDPTEEFNYKLTGKPASFKPRTRPYKR